MNSLDFIARKTPRLTDPVPTFHHAPILGDDDQADASAYIVARRYTLEPYFLMIEYTDTKGAMTRRRITTHTIEERGPTIMLGAFCHERNAPRLFRLDSISCIIGPEGEIEDPAPWFADVMAASDFTDTIECIRQPKALVSVYTQLRRAIGPALTVLIAAARSDDYLHPGECETILRYCEDAAAALHDQGALTAFPTAADFDKLERTMLRLRPTRDELTEVFPAIADMTRPQMRRLATALADTIRADGAVDDIEAAIAEDLRSLGVSRHGFGWDD